MVVSLNNSYLLGLYGISATTSDTSGATAAPAAKKVAPTAPWSNTPKPAEAAAQASATVKAAIVGRKFIDEDAAQLDLKGASTDYKKLFALYQGMTALSDVASRYQAKGVTSLEKAQLTKTFSRGMAEITKYIDTASFEQLRMAQGTASALAKATLAMPKAATEYVTKPLTSSTTEEVPAFQGNVRFSIDIKKVNVDHQLTIDLGGMGSTPRTIGNVITYINDQLAAEGVETRIQTQRIPGQPRQVTAGGKTITLPAGADQWALKVKVGTSETVKFSADTAPAVYVAQSVGNPDPDGKAATKDGVTQRQLLKFQADTTGLVPAPPQMAGEANYVEDRVFAQTLDAGVTAVHAQAVGPDGAVYMLADVTGTTDGQALKGTQDVALLKYDSAGKLLYTRTLGAAGSATGLALAVDANGQVAIAGAVTGGLGGAVDGALNSGPTATTSDSFVTLYDAEGEEVWTQRRGARMDDEASEVAFGADGTVYVAGKAKSALPGTAAVGGQDSYVEAFKADAKGKVATLFSQAFGTAGTDKPAGLVVDGSALVTASNEDGHAILRRFDISSGSPVLESTRDLGDLMGGDIAGLALDGGQVVIAGTTKNGTLTAGTLLRPISGGTDAFVARVASTLAADPADTLAYYGGTGDDRATSLAVAGGQVYIGGTAGTDLPNQPAVGTKDGFLARIDLTDGTVDWSRRFTGKDGMAAPTAIAVDPGGASALDRLGLPQGELQLSKTDKLTEASSLRAGDQFTVKIGEGRAQAVTIEAGETLDSLAMKIRRASSFQAKVSITTVSGVRQLKVEPISPRVVVELGPGPSGKDALKMLGIPEGVVRLTQIGEDGKPKPADGKSQIYGLAFDGDLNLTSDEQIRHALAELATAMGVVRTAYKDLVAAATPKSQTALAAAAGKAPAYLTNQIANYQAALDRLTGGSS